MNQDITYYAKNRYAAKAFDPNRTIPEENVGKVKELLRYSPSSTNAQPWHFLLVSSEQGKEKVAKATDQSFPFNSAAIRNASHVVVFCRRTDIGEEFLLRVLAQEEKDGRFLSNPDEFKNGMHAGRSMFVNLHKNELNDVDDWMGKQVYLNLGAFLLGVSALGIDATPMEGVDTKVLDEEFDLPAKGYTSLVVVPIGYHDDNEDYNASLPKSRLPYGEILTEA